MKRWMLTGILAASFSGACVLPVIAGETAPATTKKAEKKEEQVKLADLPQAVQDAIKKEVGAGKIDEIEKETKDGKTVYSVDAKIDGKEYDLTFGEDGKLISKELEDDDKDEQEEKEEKGSKKEMK